MVGAVVALYQREEYRITSHHFASLRKSSQTTTRPLRLLQEDRLERR